MGGPVGNMNPIRPPPGGMPPNPMMGPRGPMMMHPGDPNMMQNPSLGPIMNFQNMPMGKNFGK